MKAIQFRTFGGPAELRLVQIDAPEPGPGQVAIDVRVAGVNFAETMHRRGLLGGELPAVPGLEAAGVVAALGPGVTSLAVGEPVAAFTWYPGQTMGGYAERVVVDARVAVSLRRPERTLSFEEAAGFPCAGLTAYQVLADAGRIRAGETVLIQAAAGGVGTLAAQFARALGAGRVIGVVGSARKRDAAIEAGCDDVVLQEGFEKPVMQLTRQQGVDLVLESVGGESLRASLRVLAPLGRVVTFGNASASEPNDLSAFDLWFQARGVQGYNIAHLAAAHPERWQKAAGEAIGYVARAAVRLRPSVVFPLAEAARAHEAIESRQATGKLVLSVGA